MLDLGIRRAELFVIRAECRFSAVDGFRDWRHRGGTGGSHYGAHDRAPVARGVRESLGCPRTGSPGGGRTTPSTLRRLDPGRGLRHDDPEVLPEHLAGACLAGLRQLDPAEAGVRILDPSLLFEVVQARDLWTHAEPVLAVMLGEPEKRDRNFLHLLPVRYLLVCGGFAHARVTASDGRRRSTLRLRALASEVEGRGSGCVACSARATNHHDRIRVVQINALDEGSIPSTLVSKDTRRCSSIIVKSPETRADHAERAIRAEVEFRHDEASRQWDLVFNGMFPRRR